jgi:hypothetical protein
MPASAQAAWLFDFDIGIPTLKSGDFRVSGGLSTGWGLEHFGVLVSGHAGWYDFASDELSSNNFEAKAGLHGYYLLGKPPSALRGELGSIWDTPTLTSNTSPARATRSSMIIYL